MKTCFKCGRALPLEEFYRHPMMADGHLGKCKECTCVDVRLNWMARRDKYLAYERARLNAPHRVAARKRRAASLDGKIDARVRDVAYRLNHPERYAAHTMVHNHLRDGKLHRKPCERCGAPKAHAHHDDYSKPLDVRWLCRKHHMEHHKGVR